MRKKYIRTSDEEYAKIKEAQEAIISNGLNALPFETSVQDFALGSVVALGAEALIYILNK